MAQPLPRASASRLSGSARVSSLRAPVRLALAVLVALAVLATASPRAARAEPNRLPEPPPGGLTQGVAGTSQPSEVVAAQSFSVETVAMLVPETQTWLVYLTGAPDAVNTLTPATLTEQSIVTILRTGVLVARGPQPRPPDEPPAVTGGGNVLQTPPPGGLVHGVAGTNDPATLVARQQFPVESVSTLHVPSQTWLVHLPFAPAFVSSLRTGMLDESSVVTVRRQAPPAPAPLPAPATASPPPAGTPDTSPLSVNVSAESVIYASVNEDRVAGGLAPLVLDPALVDVARAHSRDMIARDFFDQENPDGEDPFDRMRNAGITFGYAAENIVVGQSGTNAHAILMASAPHRASILGTVYRRVGIGAIMRPEGGVMVTEIFAD